MLGKCVLRDKLLALQFFNPRLSVPLVPPPVSPLPEPVFTPVIVPVPGKV